MNLTATPEQWAAIVKTGEGWIVCDSPDGLIVECDGVFHEGGWPDGCDGTEIRRVYVLAAAGRCAGRSRFRHTRDTRQGHDQRPDCLDCLAALGTVQVSEVLPIERLEVFSGHWPAVTISITRGMYGTLWSCWYWPVTVAEPEQIDLDIGPDPAAHIGGHAAHVTDPRSTT